MSNIAFGVHFIDVKTGEDIKYHITSFRYIGDTQEIDATIENGLNVSQFKITTYDAVNNGIIDLEKLKQFINLK